MTYRNSLQGRFVATGYPAAGMAFVSIILWAAAALFAIDGYNPLPGILPLGFWSSRLLSLVLYVLAALLLGQLYVLERRAQWLPSLFMWFTAVFMFVQPCYTVALSVLLLLLSVAQLLSCVADKGQERAVFGAFAMLSFSSLLCVQSVLLLPMFFAYMFISRVTGWRNFMAALLGVATPWWLLLGTVYMFPSLSVMLQPLSSSGEALVSFTGFSCPPVFYAWVAVEFVVWAVATYIFASSFYPAKTLLRRRFLFFILLNVYLMLLTFAVPHNFLLFLVWRMPGLAIMASYIFAMKVTKLSNIFFISLNAVWLLIAFVCLWIG